MFKFLTKPLISGSLALFTGFGAMFGTTGIIRTIKSNNVQEEEQIIEEEIPYQKSHQQMLLDNTLAMGTFNVLGDIDFTLENGTEIKLNLNLDADISSFENVKLEGTVNLNVLDFVIDANIGFYKDTLFLDYGDNHFYLETSNMMDFISMLPQYGIALEIPEGLNNIDLLTITSIINEMEEKTDSNGEIYFLLNLDGINLYIESTDDYHVKGLRSDVIDYNGSKIKIDAKVNKVDALELVSPKEKEDFDKYQNFSPAFNIYKSLYTAFKDKQNKVILSASIEKKNENEEFESLLDTDIKFDYDINNLSFSLDGAIKENQREHRFNACFDYFGAAYIDFNSLKLSVNLQSVVETVQFVLDYLDFDLTEKLLNGVNDFLSSEELANVKKNLYELIGEIKLDENSFSIEIDTDSLGLGLGVIKPVLKFNNDKLIAIELHDLEIKNLRISVDISTGEYEKKLIDKSEYVEFDPALTLVDAVIPLLDQKQFRIEFDALVDDNDSKTKDLYFNGGLQFDIENNFGYGEANIIDKSGYKHNIKADMKDRDTFYFSYNNKLNGKFSSKTLEDLTELVTDVVTNPDKHFMELFGDLIEKLKVTPLSLALNGDYGILLDTKIINSIETTSTSLKLNISLAIIGYADKNCDIEIDFHKDENGKGYLDALKLSNLEFDGNIISFNGYLKDFDESKEATRLNPNSSYLDFSDIKVLLQLGINTSKFEYFHFSANLSLNILNIIDKEVPVDIQIRNDNGAVQVAAEFTSVPVIAGLILNVNGNDDFKHTNGRTASIYYEGDAIYIKRVDEVDDKNLFGSGKSYTVTYSRVCDTDYFLDNLAEILLKDTLGMRDTYYNMIMKDSTTEKESNQIIYEDILKDFKWEPKANKFTFVISLYALTAVSALQDLTLVVYTDANHEQLIGVDASLSISFGISIDIDLKLTTVRKDEELNSSNELTVMNAWTKQRANDTRNVWTKLSQIQK